MPLRQSFRYTSCLCVSMYMHTEHYLVLTMQCAVLCGENVAWYALVQAKVNQLSVCLARHTRGQHDVVRVDVTVQYQAACCPGMEVDQGSGDVSAPS